MTGAAKSTDSTARMTVTSLTGTVQSLVHDHRTPRLVDVVEQQKTAFLADGHPSHAVRVDRLDRLAALIGDHAEDLVDALTDDFGSRPREISLMGDITPVLLEVAEFKRHLKSWMQDDVPHCLLDRLGVKQRVRHEPLGVVGIAGPWNFPVTLSLVPAVAALAAGNRVMVRPSTVTARTSALLATAARAYFDAAELFVVPAEAGPGSEFSKLAFDSFFFTGSPEVGRQVARDCATNLVPVTLELGGKNPVIIDADADLARAADRIARSKLVNSGQVCLSPDFVFVPQAQVDEFVSSVMATWTSLLPTIATNPAYTAVINESNYRRIVGLIDDARARGAEVHQLVPSGEQAPQASSRKVSPTLLVGVPPDAQVHTEEIFGPALVVHGYSDIEEPIAYLRSHELPLTMYWYGPDNARYQDVLARTRSGSVNGNDMFLNMMPGLPFGGVGKSGMGMYHGKYGFDTFTHSRTVAASTLPFSYAGLMSPPYSQTLNYVYRGARLLNRKALPNPGRHR